ncbi:MAG: hypothetical protein ACE366_14815 [Bradymonadia bacterium]
MKEDAFRIEWLDELLQKSDWAAELYTQGNQEWVPLALYASAATLVLALLAAALRSRVLGALTLAAAITTGVIGYKGQAADMVAVEEMKEGMAPVMDQEWAQKRVALMEDMASHPVKGARPGMIGGGVLGLLAVGLGVLKAKKKKQS